VAFQFPKEPFRVIYDAFGRLALAQQDHKMTEPVEQTCEGIPLTTSQLQQIKDIYEKVITHSPYNNLGICFEYMKFFREIKKTNPDITLQQAFQTFAPNSSHIFEKYRSGDCVALAGSLQNALQKAGFSSGIFGEFSYPSWARPPVPNAASFDWAEYNEKTECVHHCATVVRFKDEHLNDKCLVLQTFAPIPIEELDWTSFVTRLRPQESPDNIINLENTLKKQLSGKYKVLVMAPGNKKIFWIDFLRGVCFLNREAATGLTGLPCGKNGVLSLSLRDLQHPDTQGTYYIDGQPHRMSHREALRRCFSALQKEFQLPNDFEENMITLAQNLDSLIQNVLLRPISTAREALPHTDAAQLALAEAKKISTTVTATIHTLAAPRATVVAMRIKELYSEAQETFTHMERAILDNNLGGAIEKSKDVQSLTEQIKQLHTELTGTPKRIAT
jgi:hypothetical protein